MARQATGGDDLQDDFALDDAYVASDIEEDVGGMEKRQREDDQPEKKQKKKKKSKRGALPFSIPQEPQEQAAVWNKYMHKAYPGLAQLELNDIGLKEDQVFEQGGGLEDLCRSAVTGGRNKKVASGAPQVLILCSSALRVLELIRELRPVSLLRPVMKLFSRHIKIAEQKKLLASTAVDIAVGTPNRVRKLMEDGALKINRLRLVVIDCWQDDKMRVLVDMDDTRQDLFGLWRDILLPASKNPDHGFKLRLA
ncbi:hypothetical protein GGF46_004800 [Coemansia sp. RSA 552]|nr:hypothetical protein GGF46_004800 [Coemansia sp. RSA 552]